MNAAHLTWRTLSDGDDCFEAFVLEPTEPRLLVLFAVGTGGDPERHLPLLQRLAAHGCLVVAPRFERMTSLAPSADALEMRGRRLLIAFRYVEQPHLPAAGIGHSIGATMLLMLAGAVASTMAAETIRIPSERRLARLALMAPATDFFRAPGALRAVTASIIAWAGTGDEITPPGTARMLESALQGIASVEVRIVANAGHFSFMDAPPPLAAEPLSDRRAVLDRIAEDIASFVTD